MLKRFVAYYKPHLFLFTIDMVCAFLIAGIDLFFPSFTKKALDQYIPQRDLRGLITVSIVLGILFLFRAFFTYVVNYWGHIVGVRMEYNMRKDVFSHIQTLPFSFFDKVRTGKIMSRIVNDLRDITELAHHGPEDLFISLITLIGAFIILMRTDWRLTLIIFTYIPFLVWFGIKKRQKMSRAFMAERRRIADVNAQLENSISGIRLAKSFTNEDLERKNSTKVTGGLSSQESVHLKPWLRCSQALTCCRIC